MAISNDRPRFDLMYKILVVGESAVGKSNLLLRYTDDVFSPHYITTIGVDFKFHDLHVNDKHVKLQIWDTAGQERFAAIVRSFYRNTHGVLLVFDMTNAETFAEIQAKWLNDVQRYSPSTHLALVANKSDLVDQRQVSAEEARSWAAAHGMSYYEVSAKTGDGVSTVFEALTTELMEDTSIAAGNKKKTPVGPATPVDRPRSLTSWCTIL